MFSFSAIRFRGLASFLDAEVEVDVPVVRLAVFVPHVLQFSNEFDVRTRGLQPCPGRLGLLPLVLELAQPGVERIGGRMELCPSGLERLLGVGDLPFARCPLFVQPGQRIVLLAPGPALLVQFDVGAQLLHGLAGRGEDLVEPIRLRLGAAGDLRDERTIVAGAGFLPLPLGLEDAVEQVDRLMRTP